MMKRALIGLRFLFKLSRMEGQVSMSLSFNHGLLKREFSFRSLPPRSKERKNKVWSVVMSEFAPIIGFSTLPRLRRSGPNGEGTFQVKALLFPRRESYFHLSTQFLIETTYQSSLASHQESHSTICSRKAATAVNSKARATFSSNLGLWLPALRGNTHPGKPLRFISFDSTFSNSRRNGMLVQSIQGELGICSQVNVWSKPQEKDTVEKMNEILRSLTEERHQSPCSLRNQSRFHLGPLDVHGTEGGETPKRKQ
ncbi:hypothetical protein Leryth_025495 [Lithospermum erythrorhizon]|nr:hypothetical protein Leryth_025495 [Lithospermum erythrorhizon]